MSTETKLKLWHWYAVVGTTGVWVMLVCAADECARGVDCDGDDACYPIEMLIGPIAGPGEPPPAPVDRGDAERMAREWASGMPDPVQHALDTLENCDIEVLPDLTEGLDPEYQEQQHEQARYLIRRGLLCRTDEAGARQRTGSASLDSMCHTWATDFDQQGEEYREKVRALMRPLHDRHVIGLVADAERELLRVESERDEWKRKAELANDIVAEQTAKTASLPGRVPEGHKRVRIAVSVTEDGQYLACATGGGCDDAEAIANIDDWFGCGRVEFSFIEADVPLPRKPETVRGRVVEAT